MTRLRVDTREPRTATRALAHEVRSAPSTQAIAGATVSPQLPPRAGVMAKGFKDEECSRGYEA